jgi:hypothetical protein
MINGLVYCLFFHGNNNNFPANNPDKKPAKWAALSIEGMTHPKPIPISIITKIVYVLNPSISFLVLYAKNNKAPESPYMAPDAPADTVLLKKMLAILPIIPEVK